MTEVSYPWWLILLAIIMAVAAVFDWLGIL